MPTPISSSIIGSREKFLLYGDPGMSKTFTSLTAPFPIYHMSIGGPNEAKTFFSKQFQEKFGKRLRPESLLTDSIVEETDKKGRVKDPTGFDETCQKLDQALEADDKGTIHFETVVIDNATVLEEYQMHKVIKISDMSRSANSEGASTYSKLQAEGILQPADRDWGGAQSLMDKFVSWLFSLDKHVVLIAHEWEQTKQNRATQQSDVIAIKPLFVGKQRDRIANKFDNVWRMYKEGQLYVARTEPSDNPTVIAKTRVGGIVSSNLQSPDLTDVISKFQKYAKSISAPAKV